MPHTVAAFYRFTPLRDLPAVKAELLAAFEPLNLCGTLLLAGEGINGTLAGTAGDIEKLVAIMSQRFGLPRDEVKFSTAADKPFNRLKIRLKREIITFNQPAADPTTLAGTYVAPRDWNALIEDPEVTVLDTRNTYETMIGSFDRAEIPKIDSFTAFADYVRENLDPAKHRKVAMFCTGGIRCEKASAFMRAEGFDKVYHLKGGILKYLEEIPAAQSRWRGKCYVFDRRMAVGQGLKEGGFSMCFTCGYPLSDADKTHVMYEEGVACAYCHATTGEDDKARYRMRHKQMTA